MQHAAIPAPHSAALNHVFLRFMAFVARDYELADILSLFGGYCYMLVMWQNVDASRWVKDKKSMLDTS